MKNIRNKINSTAVILLQIILITVLFSCELSDSSSDSGGGTEELPPVIIPTGETDIKITYEEGRNWEGTQVYTIWIESDTNSTVIPVLITKRTLDNYGQMGTALAYWRKNIHSNLTSAEIDAVTSATPNVTATSSLQQLATPIPATADTRGRDGFSLIQENIPANMRKFTVYFEIEHSFDSNSYFSDQPAILYKAVIDLDAFPGNGEVKFKYSGWTLYTTTTIDGVSRTAGELQADTATVNNKKYITTCGAGEYPATEMMKNGATITIIP